MNKDSAGGPIANWGADGYFFTEAARGGPLAWRIGQTKLECDPLGPVRHAHDNAAEYYFMFSGSAYVETGGQEFVLGEGQFGYIPPDAPHNFLGPASRRDACLFCVVAPNFADNKWRVRDFHPNAESLRMEVATPFEDERLPGDEHLAARAVALSIDRSPLVLTPDGFEFVYLVVEGVVDAKLANGLHGSFPAGTFLHVRNGIGHELSATSPASMLRIDCRFEAWRGVPTAADAIAESADS
ncbi:MAG TPA: cupin domain-containing protein [Actinomycetota bacterium]|jgi:mannose-6-phosphate isomerase-like protein (cupin superfamily)|nr:cupin domain-containing protein [Actinomycetota bacterium]